VSNIPQEVFNCLQLSSVFALLALGLTLGYALSGIVNFAQADIMMVGGYAAFNADSLGFPLAALIAILVTVALGIVLERGVFRFTLKRPINGFIISLGLIAVLDNVVASHYSTNPVILKAPFAGVLTVGTSLDMPTESIFTIVITVVLLALFFVIQRNTRWGRALRATAENRSVAQLMGIRSGSYRLAAFAIGCGLAGLAGALIAAQAPITPYVGANYIVSAFAVVLVGGLGSSTGIIAGSLILGAIETFIPFSIVPDQWQPVVALVVIVIVLIVRPRGLFRGVEGAELR
jgi:branched-chain amino acid transport system permease protein